MVEQIRVAPKRTRPRSPRGHGGDDDALISRAAVLLTDPRLISSSPVQRARLIEGLQHRHGNAYVARLVQRAAALADAPPPAPAPAQKLEPTEDPKFIAVEKKIGLTAQHEKKHATAKSKAAEAQAAAHGPPDDVASQADAAQVDKMAQAKPGDFDKKAFIAAVTKAVDAAAPKNLSEAVDFKDSGKAAQVKGQISGLVGKDKQQSESGIKQASTEAPDASKAKPKLVTPMGDEPPGAAPGDAGAGQAIPSPKPASETSMDAGPAQVNDQMAKADVTEDQLKESNEPEFDAALSAKKVAEAHSKQAPDDYHATEKEVLTKAGGDAKGAAGAGLHGMHATRATALLGVTGHKSAAKAQDEAKRAEIAAKIESIFNQTRTEVTAILSGLDAKVDTAFDAGEKSAREKFETYVDQQMSAYKKKRYKGLRGKGRWLRDKFKGMPDEVNAFYRDGRDRYLKDMEKVISDVASLVGGELGRAKARIAQGREQVKSFVDGQPKALQQVAREAQQQIGGKFDELDGDVNSKQDALVQTLADKYVAARDALDQRIDELKAENKGLIDKVVDAVAGVIQTIMHLKDMLLNVLSKAAGVIGDIIKHPIRFLGNLVGAIKQGLNQFVSNIGTHLQQALMGWLFGTLGDSGIQLPESLDLKGIISLVLQVLGLTFANIRSIAVKMVGEKVVGAVEGTFKFFTTLASEGPGALWEWIQDKVADLNLEDVVIGAIKDFVITKIITAGVTWLISMLNPAAAFVKACKMIYDVIMFFIERGSQIMEFVNSILDSVGAIVAGNIGAAASLVENSLAKILPLAISFLASLLGVGGIAEKIKDIIEKIRAPITKLISAVIGPIVRPLKKLYDKGAKFVTGVIDKGKQLGQKAIAKVKQTASAAVGKVKGVFGGKDGKEKAAAPGSGTEKVKADALQEFSNRARGLASLDAFVSLRKDVLEKYRPAGLKSLTASMSGGDAPAIKVTAKASPGSKTVVTWNEVFATALAEGSDDVLDELKEMQKKFAGTNEETPPEERLVVWGALSVNGRPAGDMRQSIQGGLHAEEIILANDWDPAIQVAKGLAHSGPVQVTLALTASPCGRCSSLLSAHLMATRAGFTPIERENIKFSVASRGAYEKSKRLTKAEGAAEQAGERERITQELIESSRKRQYSLKKRLIMGMPLSQFLDWRADQERLKTRIVSGGTNPTTGERLRASTTYKDLKGLMASGWEVQVLAVKDSITESGEQLETAIKNIHKEFQTKNAV